MKATLKAFTAIATILCAVSSASASAFNPNMANIKINMPSMAPAMRFAPPTIRTDLRMRSSLGDRLVNAGESTVLPTRHKMKFTRAPAPFAKVPPKKDFKAIAAAANNIRIPVERLDSGLSGNDPFSMFGKAQNDPRNQFNGLLWGTESSGQYGNHNGWNIPGLFLSLNRLPGVGASIGGTEPGDTPDPVIFKDIYVGPDGSRTTTLLYRDGSTAGSSQWTDSHGRYNEHSDSSSPDGTRDSVDTTTRRDGSSETIYETESSMSFYRRGMDDTNNQRRAATDNLVRTITGEEGGGESASWVPPSGWGAKGPRDNLDIGPGGRPPEEGSTTPGPQLNMSRNLAVNPNPDVYAEGQGSPQAGNVRNGGAIIDPNPDPACQGPCGR